MSADYYNILGVSKNASQQEIKKAYKDLAKKYHPDISKEPNAEEKFKEVQQAYSVLGNEQKRSNYDSFGSDSERFQGAQGFGGDFDFSDIFDSFGFGNFSGGFGDFFSNSRKRGPSKGGDVIIRLNISFEEAAFGASKKIDVERIDYCDKCSGLGAEKESDIIACSACKGSGVQKQTRRTILGMFMTQSTCSTCRGSGSAIKRKCGKCNGQGLIKIKKTLTVQIPAGINIGNNLRMQNQGNVGDKGAHRGDLFIIIYVEPHDVFKRDGFDVFVELPISFSEAALGTEIVIPTLKGKAKLKIPSGTQSKTLFKLNGKGIKHLSGNSYGDQFIRVSVNTPKKPSKKMKELFKELHKEEQEVNDRKSLFSKLKDFF